MSIQNFWNETPCSDSYQANKAAQRTIDEMLCSFGPFYTEAFIRDAVSDRPALTVAHKYNLPVLAVTEMRRNLDVAIRFMLRLSSFLRQRTSALHLSARTDTLSAA